MEFEDRLQRALVRGFEGDFAGSLSDLRQLSLNYPDNLDVRYELAMTHLLLEEFGEGCAGIRYILSVDPSHEKALQQAAYC